MNTKKFMCALSLLPLAVQAQMVPAIEPVAYAAEVQDIQGFSMDRPVSLTKKEIEALKIMREWRDNPDKPAPAEDGGVVYMFGATLPTLLCAPYTVCAIRIEPGEKINNVNVGDQKRVEAEFSRVGNREQVIVKTRQSGFTSNIIISTDKRAYNIQIKATRHESIPYIEFVYPEDTQRLLAKHKAERAREIGNVTMSNGQRTDRLDFNYRISGDNPKWKPIRVYSDGRQMTIQFPSANFDHGAPVLAGIESPGGVFSDPEYEVVNYRPGPDGDTYIVDKLLDHAVLVSGAGKKQVRVDIEYTGGKK